MTPAGTGRGQGRKSNQSRPTSGPRKSRGPRDSKETRDKREPRESREPREQKQRHGQGSKRYSKRESIVGKYLPITIKSIGINGEGIGYYQKKIIFVPGALPQEEVMVMVIDENERFARGKLVSIKNPSSQRLTPPCEQYEACGGCQLQHLDYAGQLEAKRQIVIDSFQKYVPNLHVEVKPTMGMENPWGYRNKIQVQVGRGAKGELLTGLYEMGSHNLVEMSSCQVHHPKLNHILNVTKKLLADFKVPPYDERKDTGVIRTIVARYAFATNQAQLTLVTATDNLPRLKELVLELRFQLPELVTIAQNINPIKTSLVFGNDTRILWGQEQIEERLGELSYALSPRSFFQLNPQQTVHLYHEVKRQAQLTGTENVVDAYCGSGTIALWLAQDAAEVRGMDITPEAIEDAWANAERNGIKNVQFLTGKAEEVLPAWVEEGFIPDVLVVDPPRTGLDSSLIRTILKVQPQRMVYVSCNPSTLAKNVAELVAGGYEVAEVQPVDMFPMTSHVETIVALYKKD
ncbi:23S rRNA (uracil(1939)-C(5))-methyltransferase RlmD [Rubeoparvulum massiliense]|uniref:23S rRNA (uracil(1939)-C(5))-methyltransferase RlmD n=1 Tax=Rubeoparvulum massiliense TaxID=1631346 RepID=UPI0009E48BB4|nr:23S rRNA (uracil(1939)-C(5))-methyltransferase RlmD [Rubeoparvulum massiliense]